MTQRDISCPALWSSGEAMLKPRVLMAKIGRTLHLLADAGRLSAPCGLGLSRCKNTVRVNRNLRPRRRRGLPRASTQNDESQAQPNLLPHPRSAHQRVPAYPALNQDLKRAGVTLQLAGWSATRICSWLCWARRASKNTLRTPAPPGTAVCSRLGRARSSRLWRSATAYRGRWCLTNRVWPSPTPMPTGHRAADAVTG